MENKDFNVLKELYKKREKERLIIDKELEHLKALIELQGDECYLQNNSVANTNEQSTFNSLQKKQSAKNKVLSVCKNFDTDFSSTDIKAVLEKSDNVEDKLTLSYVSLLLKKLAEKNLIFIAKKGTGRGSATYYTNKQKIE